MDSAPYLRVVEKIKQVKTVESCQQKCQDNPDCDHFKWKVSKKAE